MGRKSWVCLALVLSACGDDNATLPDGGNDATPPLVTTMTIGPLGGTFTAEGGVSFDVQPAAVDAMTPITVTVTATPPSGFTAATGAVTFEPSGTVFARPITMRFPIDPTAADPTLYWSTHDGADYAPLDGTVENGILTAEVSHFSTGFVADKTSEFRNVELTAIDTYILPTAIKNVPRDLSSTTIEMRVPNGSGYDVRTVTGRADGTATFENVPSRTEYYLRVGSSSDYIVSSVSQVDVGQVLSGEGHQIAQQVTPLTFDLTNMKAWQDGDELTFYSVLANAYYFLAVSTDPDITNPPAVDDTALTGFGIDSRFTAPFEPYLIKNGDVATMLHHARAQSSTSVPYLAATESFTTTTLAQVDGQSSALSGAFSTGAGTTSTLALDYPVTQWDAYASQLYPAGSTVELALGRSTRHSFSVEAHPSGLEKCCLQTTLSLLSLSANEGTDLVSGTMSYLVPDDATYGLFGFASSAYRVCRFAPGASARACVQVAMRRFDTLAAVTSAPLVPITFPVQNISVDNVALNGDITGVGLTPRVQWEKAPLSSDHMYVVTLREFPLTGGSNVVATFRLRGGTAIVVPSGLMQTGKVYAVTINAIHGRLGGYRIQLPEQAAGVFSYFFST
jgi:hypothetical protein